MKIDLEVYNLLKGGAEFFSDQNNWCSCTFKMVKRRGLLGIGRTYRHCAVGYISANTKNNEIRDQAVELLTEAGGSNPMYVNDMEGYEATLDMYRKAAELAKKRLYDQGVQ